LSKAKELVILCGGQGTRLGEETKTKPKPLVEIGGKPILWHIMKLYSSYGVKRFILALGYKGEKIKEYFYHDLELKEGGEVCGSKQIEEGWEIVFADTGLETLKGGRIKRIEKYIQDVTFHLTYGDGISDINIDELIDFHKSHSSLGTVTAVRPPSRFGELNIDNKNNVVGLEEKPQMGQGLINGGFFVFDKKLFSYLDDSIACDFEFGPLQEITKDRQLKAFHHSGFWQCMDNVRERDYLNELIKQNLAPWITW
tara:strand:- start:17 stop:781 length:765 start_codon:yes stop_codon:yes gene_type:complete